MKREIDKRIVATSEFLFPVKISILLSFPHYFHGFFLRCGRSHFNHDWARGCALINARSLLDDEHRHADERANIRKKQKGETEREKENVPREEEEEGEEILSRACTRRRSTSSQRAGGANLRFRDFFLPSCEREGRVRLIASLSN